MRRILTLQRDALTDLAPAELASVAGGPISEQIDTSCVMDLTWDVKDLLKYTREGCTPAYGG